MSAEDHDLDAAELVLGTLDETEARRLKADLAHDAALRARVAGWEELLAALDSAPPGEEPPADLWARIEADLDGARQVPKPDFPSITVKADEGEWFSRGEGVEKKILLRDREQGVESYLLRLAPGASIRGHAHSLTEECVMLEGDVRVGSITLGPGDFHAVLAGTDHPPITSRGGALFYIRAQLREAS